MLKAWFTNDECKSWVEAWGFIKQIFQLLACGVLVAYYPPCSPREQNIGLPYLELLRQVPELRIESI